MPVRTPGVLPLLLLAACARAPTFLADMGEVVVSVGYEYVDNVDVPDRVGPAGVSLLPAEGCPTFLGEGTFQGDPLTLFEAGHTEVTTTFFFPDTVCFSPSLGTEAARDRSGDSLSVLLEDVSTTWSIRAEGGLDMGYTRVGEDVLHVGDTFELAWEGPGAPQYALVRAQQGDRWPSFVYEVAEDGTVHLEVGDDTEPGTVLLSVDAGVPYAAETCEGPSRCDVYATYRGELAVVVE